MHSLPVFGVPGAPDVELSRSPAATRVGQLAAASGLRLAHFEHRVHLPTPEHWLPQDRPDLTPSGGHLAEHKYGQHRNDGLVGSFNPGHRAKWTAHELCHGLVGFAWHPDASPLFHALSARLSEVLPVALWYFFDEVGLRRCPDHQGPLFGAFCSPCEQAARKGPRAGDAAASRDARFRADGLAFVEAELAAVARSRREGRPVPHRLATLDLMSDALAYTAGHLGRLSSPEFHRYIEYFHSDGTSGRAADLDGLIQRIEGLTSALVDGTPVAPWALTPDQVVAQDLGWRLLQVAAECEEDAAQALDGLARRLAEAPDAVAEVIAGYDAASEDWWLPPAAEVFGVGYALGPHGRSEALLVTALSEALPGTEALLGEDLPARVAQFVQADTQTRGPAARRFAAWLAGVEPGPVAEVARYEAACNFPAAPDDAVDTLGPGVGPEVPAHGVEVLHLTVDPAAILQALDDDSFAPDEAEKPTRLAIRQRPGGEVLVVDVSAAAAAFLAGEAPLSSVPADEQATLAQLGFTRPSRWEAD